MYNLPIN